MILVQESDSSDNGTGEKTGVILVQESDSSDIGTGERQE